MGDFREFTLPKSEEEVAILNKCLGILIQNNQLLDKEIASLCNRNESLSKRIKYCLIETGAAKESPNMTIRVLPTEYTKKYLDTDFYTLIYKEKAEKEEKSNLELIKLKKDIANLKRQKWISITALILSVISLFKEYILEHIF